jgi:glycosyltransferase involved in cell wall biosynthesis
MLTISLVTLGDPDRLTGGYLYHRRMAELAPRFDARIEFVSFPDLRFPLPLLAAGGLLQRIRRARPGAIVLDSIAAAFAAPWSVFPQSGPPLIAMLHQPPGGIDHGALRTGIQSWLDRAAYARAHLLLVASEALADELAAQGVPRQHTRVIPPGRDVAEAAGPPVGDLRQGHRAAFLCVGNWIERKGILSLLDAFARLPADDGTLHLVGDVDADPAYARRVRSRLALPGLADRVVVHGPVSRETVASLYRSADVFALASVKEPFGTVYGEAMAFGLPVVGWRAGNLPHLAEDGVEGLVVEPGDIEGLTRALQSLAEDEELRQSLGQAAAKRALQRPTWEESAELFFGAIREVVG